VRAQIARAIRTNGTSGIASAKMTPKTAMATANSTMSRTNGSISKPKISLKNETEDKERQDEREKQDAEKQAEHTAIYGRRPPEVRVP